jgi:hypothetical protein
MEHKQSLEAIKILKTILEEEGDEVKARASAS